MFWSYEKSTCTNWGHQSSFHHFMSCTLISNEPCQFPLPFLFLPKTCRQATQQEGWMGLRPPWVSEEKARKSSAGGDFLWTSVNTAAREEQNLHSWSPCGQKKWKTDDIFHSVKHWEVENTYEEDVMWFQEETHTGIHTHIYIRGHCK